MQRHAAPTPGTMSGAMSRDAVPARSWFLRLRRAALAAALVIAPIVIVLMTVDRLDGRVQFHCLLVRLGPSSGMHLELCDAEELTITIDARENLTCNGPPLQPGAWIGVRHGDEHPTGLPQNVTYWGRFGEEQLLLTEYRGNPSMLWVRLVLSELLVPALLIWLVVLVRWLLCIRRNRVRIERGQCPACGYDLRGSPGLCPECGAGTASTMTPTELRGPSPAPGASHR